MKKMIKSFLALAATIGFASVGLAATSITNAMGDVWSCKYTGSGTPKVASVSTPDWEEFVYVEAKDGTVTFTSVYDTTNEVVIVLDPNGATRGEDWPEDNTIRLTVRSATISKTIMAWNDPACPDDRRDPNNKSNSTIRIVTHILKGNIQTRDPNVLFLGTRCGAHDLTRDTVMKSINALLSIGNVDYYLFDSDTSASAAAAEGYTGKKLKGETVEASDIYSSEFKSSGNHSALSGFYNELYKIATDDDTHMRAGDVYKYDYIVIETDGTRLAHQYALDEDDEQLAKMKRVAEYLAPFYENKKMIWVLDNGFDYYYNDLENTSGETPNHNYFEYATEAGGYSQEIYQYGRTYDTAVTNAYRVNNGYIRNSNQANQYFSRLEDSAWKAFVGIFDPSLYLDYVTNKTTQFYVETKNADVRVSTGSSSYGKETLSLYAGHEYEIQTWYDNAESLGVYLKEVVKPVPFNATISDSIKINMGLSLAGNEEDVRFYEAKDWKKGDDPMEADDDRWNKLDEGWTFADNTLTVTAKVEGVVSEWWNKIEMDLLDDGTFFENCMRTGQYEEIKDEQGKVVGYRLNPNDGEAIIELIDPSTGKSLLKKAAAALPTDQLEYKPRNMKVEFGNAVKQYDGIGTNIWLKSGPKDAENGIDILNFVISNSFDKANWYAMDDFPGLTNATVYANGEEYASNVFWMVSAPGYNTTNGWNTVMITQRVITVEAVSTNKVYGADDPKPFAWNLVNEETVLATELEDVRAAIDAADVVNLTNKLQRCNTNDYTFVNVEQDVGTYGRVITTNEPFAAHYDGVLQNYRLEFEPGDFRIDSAELRFVDVGGYTNVYDGAEHGITFTLEPPTDGATLPQVSFSTDDRQSWSEWATWNAGIDKGPTFTNCCEQPVWVKARILPNYPEIMTNATVVITQRVVVVTAGTDSKIYDGKALTNGTYTTSTYEVGGIYGFVPDEGFSSVKMTDESTITSTGSVANVIGTWSLNSKTSRGNYIIQEEPGTLTITPAQILDESDKEETERTKPWAAATDVVLWTNDVPSVLSTGTNIAVDVKLYGDDKAKAKYEYTFSTNAPVSWMSSDAIKAVLNHICSTQVWCRVSCENYLPTNVTAWVTILAKEAEVHDEKADGVDKPLPNGAMHQATSNVLNQIVANNPTSENYNPDTLLKWEADQLDGRVHLEFTSITNLPEGKMEAATNHLQQAIASVPSESWTDVSGRSVDVSLIYWQTFKGGEVKTNDIGGVNTELIPFTLSLDLSGGLEVVKVIRYHGAEAMTLSKTSAGEGYSVSGSGASATITIRSKKYSEFIIIMGKSYTPPVPPTPTPEPDPVPLKIFVDDRTVFEGDPVPALGFKEGAARYECAEPVDESKIKGKAVFSTTYQQGSPVGAYVINATGLTSSYYSITIVPGVLTVIPALQEWLYPDGDGCQTIEGDKAQSYVGTIVCTNEVGGGVAGTLEVKTSKPNKNGLVMVKATVTLRRNKKKLTYSTKNVDIHDGVCSLPVVMKPTWCNCDGIEYAEYPLTLVFNGDAMHGEFNGDCIIDGGRNVFATSADPKRAAIASLVGTWNGVLSVEGDEPGLAQFSANLQKSGKVSAKCWMPDGTEISWSTLVHVGSNDFCVIPLVFGRASKALIRSAGLRLTFDFVNEAVLLRSVSDWESCRSTGEFVKTLGELTPLAVGQPAMTVDTFKTLQPEVIGLPEGLSAQPEKSSLKLNAKTGRITGTMSWTVINEKGRKQKVSGKVNGLVVGTDCIASVTIKNLGTYVVRFDEPEEAEAK